MENFNKNWLIILLIAVVFLILGFLLGRITGHPHDMHGSRMGNMRVEHGHGQRKMHMGGEGGDITIKIDTISNDGEKMEIKVEKKVKK